MVAGNKTKYTASTDVPIFKSFTGKALVRMVIKSVRKRTVECSNLDTMAGYFSTGFPVLILFPVHACTYD